MVIREQHARCACTSPVGTVTDTVVPLPGDDLTANVPAEHHDSFIEAGEPEPLAPKEFVSREAAAIVGHGHGHGAVLS